jgi:heat shock protein HtpX
LNPSGDPIYQKELTMRQNNYLNHRLTNLMHTLLLFGGMLILLALIGWSLAGLSGLVWASILGGLLVFLTARVPSQLVLRMSGARPLAVGEAPGLHKVVRELSSRAGLPVVPQLYYLPNSMLNALTVNGQDSPAIAVTNGLIRQLDGRELTGVLAHEISHLRQKDLLVLRFAGAISRITNLFSFLGQVLLFVNIPLVLMGQSPISWFTILILLAAPTLSGLLQMALSRTREFDADLGAAWLTGDPEGLARALEKMARVQAGFFRRFLWPQNISTKTSPFSTHPAAGERVARLRSLTDVQPRPPILDQGEIVRGPGYPPFQNLIPSRRFFRFLM